MLPAYFPQAKLFTGEHHAEMPRRTLYNAVMRLSELNDFCRLSFKFLCLGICLGISVLLVMPVSAQSFSYETEYPGVNYSSGPLSDRLTRLVQDIDSGKVELQYDAEGRGYLDALLEALEIDPSSQFLVFSKTALKTRFVNARTPRALYFNDDTYVGFIQDSRSLEIAAMDPVLGSVFFDFSQDPDQPIAPGREMSRCLRCHDSYSMTGGGVSRFLLSSVLADPEGEIVTHEVSIISDTSTPLNRRWGGMYVTGLHGDQETLGNFVIDDVSKLANLNLAINGNKVELSEYIDTTPYISSGSDIVALLVLEHQIELQNRLIRMSYESRTRLFQEGDINEQTLAELGKPFLESMFMLNEVALTETVSGTSGFTEYFQSLGPFDSQGRSLRELDLESRTFKYPFSYQIYSDAFDSLPDKVKTYLYSRIRTILLEEDSDPVFSAIAKADLVAIAAILQETKPEIFN
jgi:hypothetical protein